MLQTMSKQEQADRGGGANEGGDRDRGGQRKPLPADGRGTCLNKGRRTRRGPLRGKPQRKGKTKGSGRD